MNEPGGTKRPLKPMPVGKLIDELSKHPRDALITDLWLEADYPAGPASGHVQISLGAIAEWGSAKSCPDSCRCRRPVSL